MQQSIQRRRAPSIRSIAREQGISRHAAARLRDTLPSGYKVWMLAFDLHGEHADPAILNLFEDVQQDLKPDYTVFGSTRTGTSTSMWFAWSGRRLW